MNGNILNNVTILVNQMLFYEFSEKMNITANSAFIRIY